MSLRKLHFSMQQPLVDDLHILCKLNPTSDTRWQHCSLQATTAHQCTQTSSAPLFMFKLPAATKTLRSVWKLLTHLRRTGRGRSAAMVIIKRQEITFS